MRTLMGLVLVSGLVIGLAGESKAQFGLSIGTPPGYSYGFPNYSSYGYSGIGLGGLGGYNNYGYTGIGLGGLGGYNSYYNSGVLGGLGGFSYSSGYRGVTTPVAPLSGYGYSYGGIRPYYGGYGVRPYYGGYGIRPNYGGYGYRGYGYGYRRGFRPFGGMFR